jgi:hypothetical protein
VTRVLTVSFLSTHSTADPLTLALFNHLAVHISWLESRGSGASPEEIRYFSDYSKVNLVYIAHHGFAQIN